MSAWANRIIIFLSCLGIWIAGVLSYAKAQNHLLPCQAGGSGCDTVNSSSLAEVMHIPIAYFGLAAYFVFLFLGVGRIFARSWWHKLSVVGLLMSGVGLGISCYLTFASIMFIHAECVWCLGSASLMLLLFLAHAYLVNTKDVPTDPVKVDDFATFGVSAVVCLGLLTMTTQQMQYVVGAKTITLPKGVTLEDVMGPAYKRRGNADAKVTLVEFADFNCPSCRINAPMVLQAYQKYGGRLRVVFRNFPLTNIPGHETSTLAATFCELANEKGKYWEWVDAAYEKSNTERVKDQSGEGLIGIANDIGLPGTAMSAKIDAGQADSATNAITDDVAMAHSTLGMTGTPSFALFTQEGQPIVSLGPQNWYGTLNSEPYRSLLAK